MKLGTLRFSRQHRAARARMLNRGRAGIHSVIATPISIDTLRAGWVGDPPPGGFDQYVERFGQPLRLSEP